MDERGSGVHPGGPGWGDPSPGRWFNLSTQQLRHNFVKDDPPLAMGAAPGIDRLIVFGGGYPIMVGEAVVGGIGVSGGHYSQDMEVAQAGLSALASF